MVSRILALEIFIEELLETKTLKNNQPGRGLAKKRGIKMNIFIPVWVLIPVAVIIGFLAFVGAAVLWVAYAEGHWYVLRRIRHSRKKRRMAYEV